MGRNINPKSLKGKDKMNRIKNLMGRMETLNESTSLSELDLVKKGPNGVIYGIVRENHKYFIKTTDKSSGNLLAEDFDYIGGLQNKFSESYDSYAEATKQLNLKFDMLNESFGIETNNNILESDGIAIGGGAGFGFVVESETCEQCGKEICECSEGEEEIITDEVDEIEEQQKVLKVDAPAAPAEPAMEEPVEDEVPDDMGMEDTMDDAGMEDTMEEPSMDDEGDDEDNPTKKIQKMTGKIGQMLRDMDEPDVDLEKYVINSVISAMHLDLFSDEDVEDIVNKLEGEDEEDDMAADEMGGEDLGMEEPALEEPSMEEEPMEEPDLAEESFKITKGDLVESLTKKILKDTLNESDDYGTMKASSQRVRDKVNKRRSKLKGKQYKLDKNKNGRIDADDFRRLRKSKNEDFHMGEHHMGDVATHTDYPKYDVDAYKIMDEDFDIISDYIDCPQCEGRGCDHCGGMGYHLSNEFELSNTYNDWSEEDSEPTTKRLGLDGIDDDFMTMNADGEYGPFDRDGDEIPADIDLDDNNDGIIDEMDGDGYGIDVMDSISGSIDVDGDGISAKIDNSMYGDGDDDLDIKFFSSPTIKPKEPTTTPKTPTTPRRGPWTKPKTQPKPKARDGETPRERRSFRRKGFYR
jgi:hypothetical protein